MTSFVLSEPPHIGVGYTKYKIHKIVYKIRYTMHNTCIQNTKYNIQYAINKIFVYNIHHTPHTILYKLYNIMYTICYIICAICILYTVLHIQYTYIWYNKKPCIQYIQGLYIKRFSQDSTVHRPERIKLK